MMRVPKDEAVREQVVSNLQATENASKILDLSKACWLAPWHFAEEHRLLDAETGHW